MYKKLKSIVFILIGFKCILSLIFLGLSNIVMLEFRSELLELGAEFNNCTYPLIGALHDNQLYISRLLMEIASNISNDDNHGYWVRGRIALAEGDFQSAAHAMNMIDIEYWDNPVLFQDAWVAFDLGVEFENLIYLYKVSSSSNNIPYPYSTRLPTSIKERVISDTLSLAYLDTMGDGGLGSVLQFRPNDAYVNYYLREQIKQSEDRQIYEEEFPELSLASFYSTDKRYLEYTLQSIPFLVEEGVLNIEVASRILRFFVSYYQGEVEVSDALVELAEFSSSNSEIPFCLAEYHRVRGELDSAKEIYQKLYTSDPQNSIILLRMGMILEAKCDNGESNFCEDELRRAVNGYEKYCSFEPNNLFCDKKLADAYEFLDSIKNDSLVKETATNLRTNWMRKAIELGPEVEVNYELNEAWLFLGYRCDEASLSQGKPTPLWLYWRGSDGSYAGDESEGWYNLGDGLWIQIVEDAHNLIFDGGFDLSLLQGNAMAFPYDIYSSSPANREVVTEKFVNDKETAVALLNNTLDNMTSFTSYLIPVDVNALYLQTGWIKSEGGKAYIGRRWLGCTPRGQGLYSYVVLNATHTDWRHYAGLGEPLSGSRWAEVWLLNFKSSGSAYFDDVNFVKIGRPGQ
jgi:tetratricopeptide (TPR) repeat protein